MTKRTDAQQLLLDLLPSIREIFWIARVWNDHNFNTRDVLDKCNAITDHLVGGSRPDGVDACNQWMERAVEATKDKT